MASKLLKRDCYGDGGGFSLPEDIILEVLLRLPAKALYRFRCVSRSWRALITDPSFVATLRSRATGKVIVAVFGHELRLLDKGGNVLMVFDVMVFDDRCRNALLAPTRLDRILVDRGQLGAMIIDPASMRDFTIVGTNDPPPPSWANSSMISDYSFGRAALSGDYKVLRLATSSNYVQPNRRWCQVATIMDGGTEPTWRQRPWCPFDGLSRKDKATANGVLYFMLGNTYLESPRIVAFDLESEEWKPEVINGPLLAQKNKDEKWCITLTELMGTLCMVHTIQYLADIWLLQNPNKSVWVKEYKIHMPERLLLSTKPLGVSTDGKLLLLNEFWKAGNNNNCRRYMIQLYNSSTKAVTDFMEMAPGFIGEIAFYTGSLKS